MKWVWVRFAVSFRRAPLNHIVPSSGVDVRSSILLVSGDGKNLISTPKVMAGGEP